MQIWLLIFQLKKLWSTEYSWGLFYFQHSDEKKAFDKKKNDVHH